MERMTGVDAQAYWMSAKIPSDQFLLYCFTDVAESCADIGSSLLQRAGTIGDLCLRAAEVPGTLDYPYWVPTQVEPAQLRRHTVDSWDACLRTLADAMSDQLDVRSCAWRLHLFGPITDAPGAAGRRSVVVVLQISHALADGSRASAIARRLMSTAPDDPLIAMPQQGFRPVMAALTGVGRTPFTLARLLPAAGRAHRAHRHRESAVAAGDLPAAPTGGPLAAVNVAPDDRRELRVILTRADRLRELGPTVTVGALVAVSEVLSAHLGVDPDRGLRAEVGMAKVGESHARNHFRMVAVDLCVDEIDLPRRARRIAEQMTAAVARASHPAAGAESDATALLPAALVRWGVSAFDTAAVPEAVTGNTVVSSVNRGPADLMLGGGHVAFTAGFPALSPVQTLTHGVHGIGDRIAVSICASPTGLPDVDGYRDALDVFLNG